MHNKSKSGGSAEKGIMRLRRSMLYIPGNSPRMIQNSPVFGADSLLFDLEDSVVPQEKDAARILVRNALLNIDFGNIEKTVRVNGINTPYFKDDLEAIVKALPDAVRLPKTETADDVLLLDKELEELERKHDIQVETIKIHAMIETALGVENAFRIAHSCQRINAITIGGQDLTQDMGVVKTEEGWELLYARQRIVMAAKAAQIDAFDTVYTDIGNTEGLRKETAFIKNLGFTGKACIHPSQIPVIHEVFEPEDEEVEKALRIVKAMHDAALKHRGVVKVDGKMIDRPILMRAERILKIKGINIDEL